MDTSDTLKNVEEILNKGIDVVCAGLIKTLEANLGKLLQCFSRTIG